MGAINKAARQFITAEDGVIAYNFGAKDQHTVRTAIQAAGAVDAYQIESGRYIGFRNAAGKVVAYLARTYLAITPRAAIVPEGEVMSGKLEEGAVRVPLSTWEGERGGVEARSPQHRAWGATCPTCFTQRSLNGTCDTCD